MAVRVQPRGKVPANYVLQQTDDCPCNTEGDTEFNWRMRWPMSAMEKAPTLHIAVGNSYGANDTLGAQHVQPSPPPSPYLIRTQALALTLTLRFLADGELSLEALCERAAKRRTGQFLDTCANCKSPTPTRNCNRIPQPLPNPDPITRWVKCTRPGNAAGPAAASVCLTVEVLRAAPPHGQSAHPGSTLAVAELVPRTSSAAPPQRGRTWQLCTWLHLTGSLLPREGACETDPRWAPRATASSGAWHVRKPAA